MLPVNKQTRAVIHYLAVSLIWLSACESPDKSPATENTAVQADTLLRSLCFRSISGAQNRDTLAVSLTITGNKVSGTMEQVLYEKDARRGMLTGSLQDKHIMAVWTYQQEGMTDTLNLEFNLGPGELQQRPLVFNAQTQRQQTDQGALAWISIPEFDCAASAGKEAFSVSGTVGELTPGKDGYMANLTADDGKAYSITMSRIKLEKNYALLKTGDRVQVSGDTFSINNKVHIQVQQFSKY